MQNKVSPFRNGAGEGTEPLGVIDIGSNSVRLVIYNGAVRAPTPLFNEKVLCGLGRAVASTGSLGKEPVERALQALSRFRAIANVLGVKNLKAIATAAVREATDGAQFLAAGEKAAGCTIEVLSGEKEAQLASNGIMMGFVAPDGIAGDLGGGSLELVDIAGSDLSNAATLPLGVLRLVDTTSGKIDKVVSLVDSALEALPWVKDGKDRTFYAVGGTWRALAKLHMEANKYPLRVMHGYELSGSDAQSFAESVRRAKKPGDLPGISNVSKSRREVLPFGAVVLERLLRIMQPKSVVFSVFGIREGYIYHALSEQERRRDPLLSFCETFAALKARSLSHAHELCAWTDQLFDGIHVSETEEERRQRHGACLLSDIGWRSHPDYRGEQSLSMVAYAGLTGIDHPGRVFLALCVYYRHQWSDDGKDALYEQLKSLVNKHTQRRARIVGAAIRAAHMLAIGHPGVIDETRLNYEDGKLVLTISPVYAALNGERLQRRFATLANLLDMKPQIRIGT